MDFRFIFSLSGKRSVNAALLHNFSYLGFVQTCNPEDRRALRDCTVMFSGGREVLITSY